MGLMGRRLAKEQGLSMSDKKYTLLEVAKHNTPNDCWLVIQDKVYNVSKWLDVHPGGRLILSSVAGQDATEAFHGFHPPSVFYTRLPEFQIGVVSNPVKTPLMEEFHQLRKVFRKEGLYTPMYSYYVLKTILFIIHFYVAIWATLNSSSTCHYFISACILGLFWQQLSFFGHDFGHNSASQSSCTDWCFGVVQTIFYGVSGQWWKRSHNVHHTVTNSIDYDPDIQHLPVFAVDSKMCAGFFSFYHMREFLFTETAKFLVSYQHYLYFIVMAFARFNLYLQSWILCLNPKAQVPARIVEIGAMSLFFFWNYLLLGAVSGWTNRIIYLLVSHMVCGIVHCQITISHFALPAYFGQGFHPSKPNHWVEMQLATSLDVDCPWWMDWFHGGLQFQVEHHLFPRIPRNRLRYIQQKYILPLIKKHSLFHHNRTFIDCFKFVYQKMKCEAVKAREYPTASKELCSSNLKAPDTLRSLWMCEG